MSRSRVIVAVRSRVIRLACPFLLMFLALGCGISSNYIRPDHQTSSSTLSGNSRIVKSIYLIGDAGYAGDQNSTPLEALSNEASNSAGRSLVLILGDNIYPDGMPGPDHPERPRAESIVDRQISALTPPYGNSQDDEAAPNTIEGVFIPGNHDWGTWGPDGLASLREQEEYITGKDLPYVSFRPGGGSPGPDILYRNNILQVIAIDSHWWLHEHAKPNYPGLNDYRATEEKFLDSLSYLLGKYSGRLSLIVGHHPLETHGPHGGFFEWKDHIFPLRNLASWLWLPLPIIGSLYPAVRANGISNQDISGSRYRDFTERLDTIFRQHRDIIYAAGHEHSLQVIQLPSGALQLVSGNGITDHASPLSTGENTIFGSTAAGFMVLDVFESGKVVLSVVGIDDATGAATRLFVSEILVTHPIK